MITVYSEDLQSGMITARAVYTASGQLIIPAGTQLTDQLISRIHFYGIKSIQIEHTIEQKEYLKPLKPSKALSPAPSPIPNEKTSPVHNRSYSQKVQQSPKFQNFQITYSKKINSTQTALDHFLTSDEVDTRSLLSETVSLIQDSQLTVMELFDMLHNMRQVDDTIYAHSLNVSLLARVLGKWLSFSQEEIDTLTIAGLLHDIGKLKIPESIIKKPGKLTDEEFDIIKMHPRIGYDTIEKSSIDLRIKQAILMHHERCDGSGYPFGFQKDDLSPFSMVLAIVDVYDAMTAARSYRGPLCPFCVIQQFEDEGLQKFNPKYILTFLEHIAATYQNNRVLLSNGRRATIVMLNKHRLSKPIVQFEDESFLDLSKQNELTITAVI